MYCTLLLAVTVTGLQTTGKILFLARSPTCQKNYWNCYCEPSDSLHPRAFVVELPENNSSAGLIWLYMSKIGSVFGALEGTGRGNGLLSCSRDLSSSSWVNSSTGPWVIVIPSLVIFRPLESVSDS